MVTDIRRAAVQGVRVNRGPVTFGLGMIVVIFGLFGLIATGSGTSHVTMPLSMLHLTVGTAVVSAAILGPRTARVTASVAGLGLLGLGCLGVAGVTVVAPNGADIVLHFVMGLALTAVGRR